MPFPAAGLHQIVSRETFVPTIALLRKADKPRQDTAGAASRQRQPMHPPALRMAKKHRIRKKSRALTVSDAKPLGRARSRTGVMHRGAFFCPCDPRGRFRIRCLFAIRCPIGLHEGRNARCQESAIENQASPTRGNASVLTKQRGRMQVASGRTLQPLEQDAAYASAMPRLKSMIF